MQLSDDCQQPIERANHDTEPHTLCNPCKGLSDSDCRIHLTPLDRDDLELTLAWRSHPKIYRHFRAQNGPLSWNEHVSWYESRPSARHDFVIRYDGRRVGVVSLDTTDAVSIYLGDFSAHGDGVASATLRWLCDRFADRTPLYAEINETNDSSKRLFEQCGFRQQSRDGEWLQYIYTV